MFFKTSSSFDEVERFGKRLSDDIKETGCHYQTLNNFEYKSFSVNLGAKKYLSVAEYDASIQALKDRYDAYNGKDKRILETELIGLQKEREDSQKQNPSDYSIRYSILKLNDALIVLHPFELYSTLENKIHDRFPSETIWSVGYCFDCMGYLLDKDSYQNGCYEKYSSVFDENAGEEFIENVIIELSKMIGKRSV